MTHKTRKITPEKSAVVLALCAALLAFAFAGCDLGGVNRTTTDPGLNGTWANDPSVTEITFDNGNYLMVWNPPGPAGHPQQRGTFTTNNGIITMTTTHRHGSWLGAANGFGSRWYTRDETRAVLLMQGWSAGEAEWQVNAWFWAQHTVSYSFIGDALYTSLWGLKTRR